MRIKLIAVAAVLALSIALCLFSMHQVFAALDQMEYQTALLLERIDAGDLEGAGRFWRRWRTNGRRPSPCLRP